ncbi:MAG: hypothetical protein NBKEAIPA_01846 [Nitrospirae bacterium]|nr:hypothetical protein [Nitrospirota bacterium]
MLHRNPTSTHRRVRLTTEGARFLLFTLAVGTAAVNTGNNLFYLLLAMMLSLIVVSGLISELCVRRLAFKRQAPEYFFANEPGTVTLRVTNHKMRIPSFSLHLLEASDREPYDHRLRIPTLAPQASVSISYPWRIGRRGQYHLRGIQVSTSFPFNLFVKQAWYPCDTSILVCPQPLPLPPMRLGALSNLGHHHVAARRGQGTSLYNLREFRPGDDARAIHWMTTAKTSKLMLRETESEDHRQVIVAVSTVAPDDADPAFERALSIAASLVSLFLREGYEVHLLLGNQPIHTAAGPDQSLSLFHALALCERQRPAMCEVIYQAMAHALAASMEGVTIGLTPWTDPDGAATPFYNLDHMISPESDEDLFNGAGSGIPA